MDKAKAAVSDFIHKAGHHDTTVHETVAPAVTQETVKPVHHEEVQTAVDKEVHQDHYHRTVQPVQDREVLPEEHHAKLGAVQHREFDHRDHDSSKRALAQEQAQFRDERIVADTATTQSAAPVVGGEHVHHHIHETIQPVIQKETIQPHVTHTTVPIHETHHSAAKHHETSTLPPVSINEFKGKGGVLGGREERYDGFEGEPRNIGGALSQMKPGHSKTDSHHTEGVLDADSTRRTGGLTAERGLEHERSGLGHDHSRTGGLEHDSSRTGYGDSKGLSDRNDATTTQKKPSMMDKLNPKVDANGDGKAGFMK